MNIIINNPIEFYRLIQDKNYIVQNSKLLIQFRDFIELYINGCQCDRDINIKKATNIYKRLSEIDSDIKSDIKLSLLAERLIFNISGVYIFEL